MKSRSKNRVYFIIIAIIIAALWIADISLGSVLIPLKDVLSAIKGGGDGDTTRSIVMQFRLPRAIVAVVAGAALSSSGLQMQTLFRNPLAGPFVLGISSGASLGVALFLMGVPLFGVTSATMEVVKNLGVVGSAWIGSALILVAIVAVSSRIKDIMAILILGMMFGSASSSVVEILQYMSSESALKSFVVWSMASLGGVTVTQLWILVPISIVGLVISIILIKPLNMLLLGENYARTMGVNIKRVRFMIFSSTILLAGTVTAFCGPIGFIGIAIPHLARMLFRDADHRVLMPASILLGSAVMLLCDIISQVPGAEVVLPINSIAALMGVPIIVVVVARYRKTS